MSTSYFVDALLLKKPTQMSLQRELSTAMSRQSQITHLPPPAHNHTPMLPGQPLACYPRRPSELFGGCCPLCIQTPGGHLICPSNAASNLSTMKHLLPTSSASALSSSSGFTPRLPLAINTVSRLPSRRDSPSPPEYSAVDTRRIRYMNLGNIGTVAHFEIWYYSF
ncbi:unnamed protein product [Owenia fusiformis]|uniref:Uncharacterized protein n=1 Tax=Owenia fusiformis TaxID=6347 RepID=A0A8J1XM75_OWEFU|nr:unnamed protein product [Owenia fusiformis]